MRKGPKNAQQKLRDAQDTIIGSLLIGTDTLAPYSVVWRTTQLPKGSHTLTAKAYNVRSGVNQVVFKANGVQIGQPDTTPVGNTTSSANGGADHYRGVRAR